MTRKPVRGLFVTGTDTGVGKTYVAGLIARALVDSGHTVGVYKPVASGCRREGDQLVADDALALWKAAGSPGEFTYVCPQMFAAPLAPHLAARAEGKQVDPALLRAGLDYWRERSDVIVIEGAGGFMTPLSDDDYVADLAYEFGFPLVVVSRNALGTINHTLLTLIVASSYGEGLPVAGIVLNQPVPLPDDPSTSSNRRELEERAVPPVLAEVLPQASDFDRPVNWFALAEPVRRPVVNLGDGQGG